MKNFRERFRFLLLFCHNSRSKVNFKVKSIFLASKARKSVIALFHGILTGKFISGINLMIQGNLLGQFQGQIGENVIFNKH